MQACRLRSLAINSLHQRMPVSCANKLVSTTLWWFTCRLTFYWDGTCRWKKTLIVVSHDRSFLDTVTTYIIHLHGPQAAQLQGQFQPV